MLFIKIFIGIFTFLTVVVGGLLSLGWLIDNGHEFLGAVGLITWFSLVLTFCLWATLGGGFDLVENHFNAREKQRNP